MQVVTLELRQEHSLPSYALKTKFNCDEFKYFIHNSAPQVEVRIWKSTFLSLNQNICCGYANEPSQWDGSFEHPKHMFKAMDKEITAFFRSKNCLSELRHDNEGFADYFYKSMYKTHWSSKILNIVSFPNAYQSDFRIDFD